MSILQEIYESNYNPMWELEKLPPDLEKKRQAFYADLTAIGGEALFERHWDFLCEMERFTDYTNFRQGVRLGLYLMLELQQ